MPASRCLPASFRTTDLPDTDRQHVRCLHRDDVLQRAVSSGSGSLASVQMKYLPRATTLFLLCAAVALPADRIQFNRDIRPIFSDNCFACHGPDGNARQADLRLDRRPVAVERGALVPGDPAASRLVERIRHENEFLRMPPAYSGKSLSEEQRNLLVEWIRQGAEYEQHWAYIPPERPDTPDGPAGIDALVEKALVARNLEPVGLADRRTLARRLSFDLTGMPPTPEAVAAFNSDTRPDALERYIDALLGSRHYGERMAVQWLDLVRYADTVGFHGDVAVSVYPYRDYVIRSFNENRPFDQFTREQLGGDLIPNATLEQKVASAYNRLGRMTNEGGSQAKEYLAKYASDRARTVSTVWLGSTMGCAECHDHKFDPILAKDFYSMQAFFADIEEEGVFAGYGNWGERTLVPGAESRTAIERIDAKLASLNEQGAQQLEPSPENLRGFAAELGASLAKWRVLDPVTVRNDCSDPDIVGCDDFELLAEPGGFVRPEFGSASRPGKLAQILEAELGEQTVTSLLIEMFPTQACEDFYLGEVEVRWLREDEPNRRVSLKSAVPDWSTSSAKLQDLQDGNHHTGWTGNPNEEGVRRAVLVFEQPISARKGDRLQVMTVHDPIFGLHGLAYRLRMSVTDVEGFEFPVDGPVGDWLTASAWDPEQQAAIERLFLRRTGANPHWREIRELQRKKEEILDHADLTLISKSVEPRTIRVLPRGNWMDDSGEIVEPQSPSFLAAIPSEGRRLNRLDLANWLVDRDNPLTARVFVNRLWRLFFGTGLSKVLDDLGSQGEPPANPELLDWLAVEFMDSGWDVKHVVRTMVLSQTYRRSSEASPELAAADPHNRLHGRQTASRLDAEFIRDNALAVSGLLNARIGGRSAKPYQPAGHYKELNFPKREYRSDLDENQYRRGIYTHWQRTFLHPSMKAFDAPSREECAADRAQSNTPLQSLVLLNDPSYVEAAKALAVRILESGVAGDRERIDFAFRRAFSRPASIEEGEVLATFLQGQREHFRERPGQVQELIGVGLYSPPPETDSTELAAWTSVSRALLNKHEFVMKY